MNAKPVETEADRPSEPPPTTADGPRPARARRNRNLALTLAAIVALSGGSFAAGRQIASPAEIAARTAAPPASLLTVPVEKRELSADVVVRGTVRYGSPQVVSLPVSALKKNTPVVTTAAAPGTELGEGSVALAVSGRPVFVLRGAQPAYRDLGPGAVGRDVQQLEEALVRMGFDPGTSDETYDAGTADAVAAWYLAAGWVPLGPTEEQQQGLRAAQTDLNAARSDEFGAREALAAARGALAGAQDRLAAAQAAAAAAPGADSATIAKEQQDRLVAEAEVVRTSGALQAAQDAERVAALRLDEARSTQPPPAASEVAGVEAALRDASTTVAVARADAAAAQAAVSGLPSASAPGAGKAAADREAASARAEVTRARGSVELASARVDQTAAAAVGTSADGLAATMGVQVPADEVLFFPALPLRVDEAKLAAGEQVAAPVMSVSSSSLSVAASLSPADARLVTTGAAVAIEAADLGIRANGTVTVIADAPGTNGADPQRFYLEATPSDAPPSLVGASVVLTVTINSTAGDVLAVPIASLSVAADGKSRVQVQDAANKTRFVNVNPGLAAKGLVAVTPVDGVLNPGDLVVVGRGGTVGPPAATAPSSTGASPTAPSAPPAPDGPPSTVPGTPGASNGS